MIIEDNFASTSEAAFAVDCGGRIMAWNKKAERAFGYTKSQALRKRCCKLLSGRDVFGNPSCHEGCLLRIEAFNNQPINRFPIDFQTAEHGYKRFLVSTMMMHNSMGKKGFVHFCLPGSVATAGLTDKPVTRQSAINSAISLLTTRQTEVLTHLSKGLRASGIAEVMGISVSTVRNHTQQIYQKLGVHNRFEAVAVAKDILPKAAI